MKKTILILNGYDNLEIEYYKKNLYIFSDIDIFCADGGANLAWHLNLIPKKISGDMDSIKKEVYDYFAKKKIIFEKYNIEKNYTDAELLINEIYDKYDEIMIIGGIGKRIDHTLFNINLMKKYPKIYFDTPFESLKLINKSTILNIQNDTIISILPIKKSIITLEGFKYNCKNLILSIGDTRTISNIVNQKDATIHLREGELILIINKKSGS